MIGPRLVNFDLSLFKRFPITESANVQFRAEFFNILNHTNLGWPNVQPFLTDRTRNGSAGQISATSTKNREIQFGLQFVF